MRKEIKNWLDLINNFEHIEIKICWHRRIGIIVMLLMISIFLNRVFELIETPMSYMQIVVLDIAGFFWIHFLLYSIYVIIHEFAHAAKHQEYGGFRGIIYLWQNKEVVGYNIKGNGCYNELDYKYTGDQMAKVFMHPYIYASIFFCVALLIGVVTSHNIVSKGVHIVLCLVLYFSGGIGKNADYALAMQCRGKAGYFKETIKDGKFVVEQRVI